MTSKTDKVGDVLGELFHSGTSYQKGENIQLNVPQARRALLEVIKAELPKKRIIDDECADFEAEDIGYNLALTEVNAIWERLFLGEEK